MMNSADRSPGSRPGERRAASWASGNPAGRASENPAGRASENPAGRALTM